MKANLSLLLLSLIFISFSSCNKDDNNDQPAPSPAINPPPQSNGISCNPSGVNPIQTNSITAIMDGDTSDFPYTYGYLVRNAAVNLVALYNIENNFPVQYPHMYIGFESQTAVGTYNLNINSPIYLSCTLSTSGPIYGPKQGSFELLLNDTNNHIVEGKFEAMMIDDINNPTDSFQICGEFNQTLLPI